MKIRILYEERALEGFRADPGFSCLIEAHENVLFDTGTHPDVLEHNMRQAGVDPAAIDKVVISHDHDDHRDGLPYVSAHNSRAELFILPTFGPVARELAGQLRIREVPESCEVAPGIRTTGLVEGVADEHSLVLETAKGRVLVTGCSHPGVDAMIAAARELGDLWGVFGGFHSSDNLDALEGMGFLAPCHCTQHRREIAERWPDVYVEIMAGSVLEF